jgi:nucleotide-binding universal stress UspA family protein
MNVLIALDSSGSAQAALAATLARRWPDGTQFKVLTVLPAKTRGTDLSCRFDSARDHARALIELAIREIEARNQDSIVVGQIDYGDPAKKIIEVAEAWPADLIMVGSHDRNPFERMFMGSVSRTVLKQARCAVFIARNIMLWQPDLMPINRILLAVNESPECRVAIDGVLNVPWPANSRFHVFSVAKPFYDACSGWEPGAIALINCLDSEAVVRRNLETYVRSVARQLQDKFGRDCVDSTVVEGEPVDLIPQIANAWGAHLVVVGSGAKTDFFARLGSVSQAVATQAKCSVQVIRHDPVKLEMPIPSQVMHKQAS